MKHAPVERTRADEAKAKLMTALLAGRFKPGELLSERRLSAELGVSRTPLRQAIHFYSQIGLLVPEHGVGTRLRSFSLRDLREAFEVRAALEAMCGRLAAINMRATELDELEQIAVKLEGRGGTYTPMRIGELDLDFHRKIATGSNNTRLAELLDSQCTVLQTFLIQAQMVIVPPSPSAKRNAQVGSTHLDIVAALRSGAQDTAERVLRTHVLNALDGLLTFLAEVPPDIEGNQMAV